MKTAEMRQALMDALESAGVILVSVVDKEPADDGAINYICGWLCSSARVAQEREEAK